MQEQQRLKKRLHYNFIHNSSITNRALKHNNWFAPTICWPSEMYLLIWGYGIRLDCMIWCCTVNSANVSISQFRRQLRVKLADEGLWTSLSFRSTSRVDMSCDMGAAKRIYKKRNAEVGRKGSRMMIIGQACRRSFWLVIVEKEKVLEYTNYTIKLRYH